MFVRFLCSLIMIGLIAPHYSWSQTSGSEDETGANVGYEAGLHIGKLLPNQISGLTEIMGLGGLRAGYRVGHLIFLEGGFVTGKGHGAEYSNGQLGLRMDVPVENLVGTIFLGPNLSYYKPTTGGTKYYGGGHVGGGVMAMIGRSVWFRSNMTFTINPGTSLYFDFGFVFRFPGGGS